jgi:glucan phosphoethanolaminetransferase (alkaline phosphatase superfamily)
MSSSAVGGTVVTETKRAVLLLEDGWVPTDEVVVVVVNAEHVATTAQTANAAATLELFRTIIFNFAFIPQLYALYDGTNKKATGQPRLLCGCKRKLHHVVENRKSRDDVCVLVLGETKLVSISVRDCTKKISTGLSHIY